MQHFLDSTDIEIMYLVFQIIHEVTNGENTF